MNTVIHEKALELKALVDSLKTDTGYDMRPGVIDQVREKEAELALLTAGVRAEQALQPTFPRFDTQPQQSLGERFVNLKSYQAYKGSAWPTAERLDVDFKTTFSRGAGWAPQSIRTDRVAEYPTSPLSVLDLIPTGETTQAAVVYMAENAWTNAAAEVAEAGAYPEATFSLAETTATVQKIAVHLPVTDEQLEDVPRARDYIDNRLTYSLRLRLETQILSGNGTSPNLLGLLNHTGIQTQPKGTDTVLDAVFKAITKVRHTGFAEPTAIILHPTNWQTIRLTKTATEGIYLWGAPAEAGLVTVFGVPVVVTPAIGSAGTALVGAFTPHCEVAFRRDVEIQVGYNADDFTKGKKTVRADVRVAFPIYRPLAFCKVTGI